MKKLLFAVWLLTLGCLDDRPLFDKGKIAVNHCRVASERKEGWVQQEITCNYLPDSTSHEWKEYRYLDVHDVAKDTVNPFSYRCRRCRY